MVAKGKRVGDRRKKRLRPALLLLALGITGCVIAWGYLVYAAIDFGTEAREGDSGAWWFLALASVGAVACLFAGLMLVARLSRALGITSAPPTHKTDLEVAELAHPDPPPGPTGSGPSKAPGGRRAAR